MPRSKKTTGSVAVPGGLDQTQETLGILSSAELPTQKPTQSEHRADSISQRLATAFEAIEALELPADAHGAMVEILRMAFPASRIAVEASERPKSGLGSSGVAR